MQVTSVNYTVQACWIIKFYWDTDSICFVLISLSFRIFTIFLYLLNEYVLAYFFINRVETLIHFIARAPFKPGHLRSNWAWRDKDLPPALNQNSWMKYADDGTRRSDPGPSSAGSNQSTTDHREPLLGGDGGGETSKRSAISFSSWAVCLKILGSKSWNVTVIDYIHGRSKQTP